MQRCAENESMPENCFSWNANSGSGFYFSGTYVPVLLSWNLLNSKNPWFMCFGRKVGLSVNVLLISSLPNHRLCRIFKGLLIIVSCAFNVSPWSHNLFIWQLSANCVIFLLFHISCLKKWLSLRVETFNVYRESNKRTCFLFCKKNHESNCKKKPL